MNAEVKELWLNALESGEYKKARKAMHRTGSNGFCCLGVLTVEYAKANNMPYDAGQGWVEGDFGCSQGVELPPVIEEWAGLLYEDCIRLAKLNDNKPGFPIDYIRENL